MSYAELQSSLQELHLDIFGAFHPTPLDQVPDGCKTLLLIGPYEPGFWDTFKVSPEFSDGLPDPLDRWSKRIITPWAIIRNATALFPSDGPPYAPFLDWARHSGRAWVSPVRMLVHDHAGLFVSYRAAIALPVEINLPPAGPNPCDSCDTRPCKSACPVNALANAYDVSACKSYLNGPNGRDCMETGCLVRRTCPAGRKYARLPEQSAFHMASFNPQ
ncbi:ferredoxin [Profundibacter amoris]|uniref:Ferredoxin n=1 Tax=Profundibacter amoris TaxID=2171755 RepID=A0A347UCM3_9RHOB|nr:ferredoxin [Profundibacter amoris]AXX96601.1 ferredoxin [Profundibacter amoris]